jgi:hypothetical protein
MRFSFYVTSLNYRDLLSVEAENVTTICSISLTDVSALCNFPIKLVTLQVNACKE